MKGGFFMSFIHRAFLYVIRKRTKTLILFLILLVISTLVLSGISIRDATETAQLNVRQALGGVFTLDQNTGDPSKWVNTEVEGFGTRSYYGGVPLTVDLADYIMENVSSIKGYDATYINYVVPKNEDGDSLELLESEDGESGMDALLSGFGDFNSSVSAYASTNTNFNSYFAGGYIELVEGRHLVPGDTNVAIISKELADINGLSIGDTLVLQMSEYKASMMGYDAENTKIEVEIIGLFQATAKSVTSLSNWSMDNALYTTLDVVRHARPDMGDESYEHINFYVNDPGQLDNTISTIKALPDIDPTDFVINVDSSDVDSVMEPLTNMDRLIGILIVLILVVGAVILYLILANRIKERIHESGILLSLGVSKAKIIGQYLIEVALVAILAFGLSVFSSGVVAQTVGNQLLDYTLSDSVSNNSPNEIEDYDGMSIVGSDDFAPQFEGKNDLTQIQVSISATAIILLCVAGFAVICISVVLAALPILRLKPKEILSKMS